MNILLALITETDKILIGKVKASKLEEYGNLRYAFPCEGVENNNDIKNRLISEVKRQTNLDIQVIKRIGERVHPSTRNHTVYFHCSSTSGKEAIDISTTADMEEFIWVNIKDLNQYMPDLYEKVPEYFKIKFPKS